MIMKKQKSLIDNIKRPKISIEGYEESLKKSLDRFIGLPDTLLNRQNMNSAISTSQAFSSETYKTAKELLSEQWKNLTLSDSERALINSVIEANLNELLSTNEKNLIPITKSIEENEIKVENFYIKEQDYDISDIEDKLLDDRDKELQIKSEMDILIFLRGILHKGIMEDVIKTAPNKGYVCRAKLSEKELDNLILNQKYLESLGNIFRLTTFEVIYTHSSYSSYSSYDHIVYNNDDFYRNISYDALKSSLRQSQEPIWRDVRGLPDGGISGSVRTEPKYELGFAISKEFIERSIRRPHLQVAYNYKTIHDNRLPTFLDDWT